MRGCGAVMIYILNYFHCQPLSRCENRITQSKYSGGNACLKHPRHPEASSLFAQSDGNNSRHGV